ncbi:hypothetical protein GCM10008111_09620 [Alishewanella tabrizica]|uniref:Uncharacterized protein n=1 Tax=Alishewanella tabrizica TaxID=671278 RepID=A0ABQ2WKH6_9ALTE|nr:hypothetical protein GCM10008111_09620 [Alishewanella tabrizica]
MPSGDKVNKSAVASLAKAETGNSTDSADEGVAKGALATIGSDKKQKKPKNTIRINERIIHHADD